MASSIVGTVQYFQDFFDVIPGSSYAISNITPAALDATKTTFVVELASNEIYKADSLSIKKKDGTGSEADLTTVPDITPDNDNHKFTFTVLNTEFASMTAPKLKITFNATKTLA